MRPGTGWLIVCFLLVGVLLCSCGDEDGGTGTDGDTESGMVYVSASAGNDTTGTGSSTRPFKSVTAALKVAEPGMTVLVASGVYDTDNGEVFPLEIPDSVMVVGEDWENAIIRGHSQEEFVWGSVKIRGVDSALRRFTLEPGEDVKFPRRLVVHMDAATDAWLDSLRVPERAYYGVFRISDAVGTIIENCILYIDDGTRTSHGIEFNTEYGNTIIRKCVIGGFSIGISLNNHANPLIEDCTIENNRDGINLCCDSQENHDPDPDIGGGARGSAGGNAIIGNELGVDNGSSNAIYAKFNIWQNNPPVEGEDYRNTGGGSVIWQ